MSDIAIDKTVQAVFDKAMYLIDAQNESTGSTNTSDTQEYKIRTIGILNTMLDTVYSASDTYHVGADGTRPVLDDIVSFEDELDLDARILRNVLPNGLAAKLISEENPTLANYFEQTFNEQLALARATRPAEFEDIVVDPENLLEHGEFGRWSI